MDNSCRLIVAMADKCRALILESTESKSKTALPKALQAKHLLWMCEKIVEHAEVGPRTKLHRWIGFVQCAMMAHGILDLVGAKAMFDEVKKEYGESDEDLLDHLNPDSSFELEVGGES